MPGYCNDGVPPGKMYEHRDAVKASYITRINRIIDPRLIQETIAIDPVYTVGK